MVALDVLGRVHAAVMEALRAAPLTLPGGEVVYQNWDVRQALAQERQKVGRAGGAPGWLAVQRSAGRVPPLLLTFRARVAPHC